MSNARSSTTTLTIGQKLFLSFGVPLAVLVSLELLLRIVPVSSLLQQKKGDMQLEMPTWMMRDSGSRDKAARFRGDANTIDWLSIFEEAPGFRVRLVPNVERSVTNTFSQIPFDRKALYRVKANSLGFRGPEPASAKSEEGLRILVFGDSSSFGWGVNQEETYSAVLQRELSARLPERHVEVLNFAIPGDSSEYGKLIFERYAKSYEPDLVILGFGANDAKMVPQSHASQVERYRKSYALQVLTFWARKSALFGTLEALMKSGLPQSAEAKSRPHRGRVHAVKRKRYRHNLSEMATEAKTAGASNALLLSLCTPGDYASAAAKLAKAKGHLYLNGQAYLFRKLPEIKAGQVHPELVAEMREHYPRELARNELYYLTSDACHPNKLGHRLIGEKLTEMIAGAGL